MDGNNHEAPGLAALAKKAARTALGALGNRGELLAVELQEEKARLLELMIWGVAILFFGMMTAIFLTAVIILLFAPENRVYVAGAFTLLYLIGTILAAGSLNLWRLCFSAQATHEIPRRRTSAGSRNLIQ